MTTTSAPSSASRALGAASTPAPPCSRRGGDERSRVLGVRREDRARARTAAPASARAGAPRACTPAPMIASVRASARASSRVASAVTAAVRIEVTRRAVEHRGRAPGLAVEQRHDALVGVEPEARVAGEDADRLEAVDAGARRRGRRASGRARRPSRSPRSDRAQRHLRLAAGARGEHRAPSPRCTRRIGRCSVDLGLAEDQRAHQATARPIALALRRRRAGWRAPRGPARGARGASGRRRPRRRRASRAASSSASPAIEIPRSAASSSSRSSAVEDRVVDERGVALGPLRHPRAGRERLARGGTCRSASRRRAGCRRCRRPARARTAPSSSASSSRTSSE